jgi:hypothetical protein
MTTFQDGPAKGQTMMPRRAPFQDGGKFDILDQPEDSPKATEKLCCYVLVEHTGMVHLCVRGKNRGGGGMYPMATYKLYPQQPTDEEMRSNDRWQQWCMSRQAEFEKFKNEK